MIEVWKAIPGYGGHYEASSMGRIRVKDRVVEKRSNFAGGKVVKQFYKGRMLSPCASDRLGHMSVHIGLEGKKHTASVHSLVLAAFVGPRPEARGSGGVPQQRHCERQQAVKPALGHPPQQQPRPPAAWDLCERRGASNGPAYTGCSAGDTRFWIGLQGCSRIVWAFCLASPSHPAPEILGASRVTHYPFTQADLLADALRLIATTPPITTTEEITA